MSRLWPAVCIVACGACLLRPAVRAEVLASSDRGFVVRNEVAIAAPARAAYRALTSEIDRWWDPSHTVFGDAAALRLEARAGGCFCERLPDGRSVEHLHVVYADPDHELRLTGALGPLQELPVSGIMVFRLSEQPGRTVVTMQYSVSGSPPGGFMEIAPAVDAVLRGQLDRLRAHAEAAAVTGGAGVP